MDIAKTPKDLPIDIIYKIVGYIHTVEDETTLLELCQLNKPWREAALRKYLGKLMTGTLGYSSEALERYEWISNITREMIISIDEHVEFDREMKRNLDQLLNKKWTQARTLEFKMMSSMFQWIPMRKKVAYAFSNISNLKIEVHNESVADLLCWVATLMPKVTSLAVGESPKDQAIEIIKDKLLIQTLTTTARDRFKHLEFIGPYLKFRTLEVLGYSQARLESLRLDTCVLEEFNMPEELQAEKGKRAPQMVPSTHQQFPALKSLNIGMLYSKKDVMDPIDITPDRFPSLIDIELCKLPAYQLNDTDGANFSQPTNPQFFEKLYNKLLNPSNIWANAEKLSIGIHKSQKDQNLVMCFPNLRYLHIEYHQTADQFFALMHQLATQCPSLVYLEVHFYDSLRQGTVCDDVLFSSALGLVSIPRQNATKSNSYRHSSLATPTYPLKTNWRNMQWLDLTFTLFSTDVLHPLGQIEHLSFLGICLNNLQSILTLTLRPNSFSRLKGLKFQVNSEPTFNQAKGLLLLFPNLSSCEMWSQNIDQLRPQLVNAFSHIKF
ncbi:hypothetical protein H4219_002891 [Mycoemilia scoparia]|uniref:Uncharacterized protein n=1 Tax=Mycoemilia scoparia TaxID=417184 RepID=A0A9W8A5S4_9FUNG|nr:hypothetical protein H4219_002891 [Mycoemilia scoparia]